MNRQRIFIAIGVFWAVMLAGFILSKESVLRSGQEVLLKTVPVDPRDLFRGDYVILRYEISAIDLNSVRSVYESLNDAVGKKVYVALDMENGRGKAGGLFLKPPAEGLFIQGTLKSARDNQLLVEYGIESYFVPEGKGREIERHRGKNLDVVASVDRSGRAAIKALLVDGQAIRF
ncbi:MAG: GDYXXLXY domain-containing protein [Candidatus Omnitrophota bacterium]|nr:GDYXXLXY domain-containing protein [Candidatus Omnitrophota bacterium]MDZ4242335.1 GDYXXLXY domain-containing protein [Candidatus Omnitrophota bacterium]